ncbi:conserved Plasmodium protein, unknown function [Plasmodium vinckei vinckei]|uniref:Microprotein domain-containing protein n=1 Tax=Plasmodium vinckei vinckei TaxID=54757 RepID=A0A449BRR9_PLAVN|nr:conserved Plasmodium protein, unknown function [Plasmodium vinckei vinckei]KEG01960.1 hypothetical protein YYE_03479 [Plasmodium vinckei vinckei]VEV56166.1 conserved Plasmodium protein, unknown function [Plasmodium vinckei vinckei]
MNKFSFMRRFFKNVVQKNERNIMDRKKVTNVGRGTMLLMSPILFEVKHKEEENSPKTEHIFLAGKTIDFLTQKLFENEFGTSILYLSFFVAYLSLLAHDNKINLLVQKLKFKYSNNMFNVGHPNYKNYLKKRDILGKD